jgi:hypothetical protein
MVWQLLCPMEYRSQCHSGHDRRAEYAGGFMSGILVFVRKWNACYHVLRYRKGFSFADPLHHGLWLARG